MSLTDSAAWTALAEHHATLATTHLRDLLEDAGRIEVLTAEAAGVHLDLTRQRLTAESLGLLVEVARDRGVDARLRALQTGAIVNTTEARAALHTALRAPLGTPIEVDGHDVVPGVHAVLDAMRSFATAVRDGSHLGATGERIRTVVHLGIGGSHLGPAMVTTALRPYTDPDLEVRFVSNVDAADLQRALTGLDPASTLCIVASKTFTTAETLANARAARAWIVGALGERAVATHFVAVSTNLTAVGAFGIDAARTFGFWDWVGGRFSVSSAIGLPVMLAIGPDAFDDLLAGMRAMDEHAATAPLERNLPVLLALTEVWNTDLEDMSTRAVIPYAADLALLPAFLQQLEMESNGKSVDEHGDPVLAGTSPIVWGAAGTDAQHAFLQLLHQGTVIAPVDFIVVARAHEPLGDHQDVLVANAIAQAEALARGRFADEVAAQGVDPALVPHRVFAGDRPSTILMLDELTPATLGALIALHEHKVAAAGALWGIDSFDQWGVELGKVLAATILAEVRDGVDAPHDLATAATISRYRARRG
ncbi:MAG: glucose-6-phosphate isomerase [Actinomycetes bacterium]